MQSLSFAGEVIRHVGWNSLPVEGVAIVVDSLDAATENALTDQSNLLGRLRLLANVGIAAWVVPGEYCGRCLTAKVAVEALVGDIILAGDVLRRSVLEVIAWHSGVS